MFIIDRLSQSKINLLTLIENQELRIYMCGPTLYRRPHLGNFRCVIFIDFLISLMLSLNIDIKIYASITDIGHCFDNSSVDKVLSLAEEAKITYYDVVSQFYQKYINILHKLDIQLSYINYIAASSLNKEYYDHLNASINTDYVYLDANKNIKVKQTFIDQYKPELIFQGSRLQEFVIWKTDQEGIYEYNGLVGNPGWHMECFSIIKKFFTKRNTSYIDIHVGGIDLLDIHNNAEIIHSKLEDPNNKIAKAWISIGTITLTGYKMSKSDNNVIYAEDFINKYGPCVLKIVIYNAQYDSNIDINEDIIQQAINIYNNILNNIAKLIFKNYKNPNKHIDRIIFDIAEQAKAITIPDEYITIDTRKLIKAMLRQDNNNLSLIYKIDKILNTQIFQTFLQKQKLISEFMYLQDKRIELKQYKKFDEADQIRNLLLQQNFKLMEEGDVFFIY